LLEAASGFEPLNGGFADRPLTTWVRRPEGCGGLRPQCHPNYYGAFIIDPDGNNVEAVCHQVQ
jgi:hypothetical protein